MSDTGFYIQPFVENFKYFEDLVYYIPGAVNRLPSWFPMIYCYLAIVGVVKNRDLPLFFRFHVMMGILLEIGLQVIWYSSNFMPLVHFNGTLGMYYWAGVALAYVLVMMECVRCALLGTFVKIPLVSESAFLHSLFHLGGFQRPF
ncbi:protein TIC 20-IV, chloroplastic [Senna tora]|uniref:Protein TIC 20 n=1 Tax=Senna tora TaxID=362788 RepID=A0A834SLU7_9FABA|nr:protein TIC 20-IV, chloroplastic [Senna tora]